MLRHDRKLRKMAREAKMNRWREELEELAECPDKTGFREKLFGYFEQDRGLLYEEWFVGMILEADFEKDEFTLKGIANILRKPSGMLHGHTKIKLLDFLAENFADLREQGKNIMEIHEIAIEKGLYEGEYISFYTFLDRNGFLSK